MTVDIFKNHPHTRMWLKFWSTRRRSEGIQLATYRYYKILKFWTIISTTDSWFKIILIHPPFKDTYSNFTVSTIISSHAKGKLLKFSQYFRFITDDKSLNSRMDEVFLMAFLRGRKHNVDAAYKLVSKLLNIC